MSFIITNLHYLYNFPNKYFNTWEITCLRILSPEYRHSRFDICNLSYMKKRLNNNQAFGKARPKVIFLNSLLSFKKIVCQKIFLMFSKSTEYALESHLYIPLQKGTKDPKNGNKKNF